MTRARKLLLIRHSLPDTILDIDAHLWRLSAAGRDRCILLAAALAPHSPSLLATSREPKALRRRRSSDVNSVSKPFLSSGFMSTTAPASPGSARQNSNRRCERSSPDRANGSSATNRRGKRWRDFATRLMASSIITRTVTSPSSRTARSSVSTWRLLQASSHSRFGSASVCPQSLFSPCPRSGSSRSSSACRRRVR
jgi:hypothetical protein